MRSVKVVIGLLLAPFIALLVAFDTLMEIIGEIVSPCLSDKYRVNSTMTWKEYFNSLWKHP